MAHLDVGKVLQFDVCSRNGSSLRDVAADTDAADGPHGLGMQCHCTGVMPTGRVCSDRPGFAKFARVTEMLDCWWCQTRTVESYRV